MGIPGYLQGYGCLTYTNQIILMDGNFLQSVYERLGYMTKEYRTNVGQHQPILMLLVDV